MTANELETEHRKTEGVRFAVFHTWWITALATFILMGLSCQK